MALLRLYQVQKGSIQIDGIEISQATPSFVRERCFVVVTQDTFCQPESSLRSNLDPFNQHTSQEVMAALQKVHLWLYFDSSITDKCESNRILTMPLSFFPPLSVGQFQLLSLARAILKARHQRKHGRRPIVLLDEPAANLDVDHEEICSQILEEEFTKQGHTVLMITHSVRDLDERTRVGKDMVVRIIKGAARVDIFA
jgi:ATP-binding cassette subfamily C (CFTR/MRP) protein 1